MTEERNTTKTTRTRTEIHIVTQEAYDDDMELIGKIMDSIWLNRELAENYVKAATAAGRTHLYIGTHLTQD